MDIFEKEVFYYTDVKREYTRVSSGPDVANMCLKKKLKDQRLAMLDIKKIPTHKPCWFLNEEECRTEGAMKEPCKPGSNLTNSLWGRETLAPETQGSELCQQLKWDPKETQ